jgi:hypothetical protein
VRRGLVWLPRLQTMSDKPMTVPTLTMRKRKSGAELVSIVRTGTCSARPKMTRGEGDPLPSRALGALVALLNLTFLASTTCLASPTRFEVEGSMDCYWYDLAGELTMSGSLPFTVVVSNEHWRVFLFESRPGFYHEAGSDGTDNYYILHSPYAVRPDGQPLKAQGPVASGVLGRGCFPSSAQVSGIKVLWLAYASAPYLDAGSNIWMPAVWPMYRTEPESFIYDLALSRDTRPPHLPAAVDFVADDKLIEAAPRRPELLHEDEGWSRSPASPGVQALKFFYGGFLGGRYAVQEATNASGISLPARAIFQRYHLLNKPDARHLPFEVFQIVTKSVVADADVWLSLQATQKVSFADYRVMDYRLRTNGSPVDYVLYTIPVGKGIPAVGGLESFVREKLLKKGLEAESQGRRVVPLFVLAAFALVPPAALVMYRLRQRRQLQQ